MASGKTETARLLSQKLNYPFIDLDDFIEKEQGCSISNIFSKKGEIYFRRIEGEHLSNLIKSYDNLVLSLGGGTPCYGNNLNLIVNSNHVISFYLEATINTIMLRLQKDNKKRPLVAHLSKTNDYEEFIGKHLFERSTFYNQANKRIKVDDKSIDEIVEQIILELF